MNRQVDPEGAQGLLQPSYFLDPGACCYGGANLIFVPSTMQ